MKLSLELVKDFLKNVENNVLFQSDNQLMHLEKAVIYAGQKCLESHIVYIAEASALTSAEQISPDCACICIGMPSKRLRNKLKQLIVLTEDSNLLDLTNAVFEVWYQFENWERKLLLAVSSDQLRSMYQAMLDVSSDIFNNGLAIMDNAFHITFENEINVQYGGYSHSNKLDEDRAIPPETISYFKYDKDYQSITEEKDVFYYTGEMLPHRVLCKNIFQDGAFLFRIIITECRRPFRQTDEQLLNYLSGFFEKSLSLLSNQQSALSSGLSDLLSQAIESGQSNRPAIESELRRLSWAYKDTYRIISVHVSQDDLFISTLNYYSTEVAKMFPESCAFPFHDSVLAVINESRIGSLEDYTEKLSLFVRENNFRIGISNFTDDIYNIQILYRQAEMALTIGLNEKPMEWIHWFSKYTLQYIYNMLTNGSDLGQLYSPIYYRLERYDKENGSSYLETLRVYLNCNMNAVQAAKELFIQRSTMIYRLKRIREIADNNFEGRDDLLHLYLTFSIIDREKKQ